MCNVTSHHLPAQLEEVVFAHTVRGSDERQKSQKQLIKLLCVLHDIEFSIPVI